jgi:hypothetical protein
MSLGGELLPTNPETYSGGGGGGSIGGSIAAGQVAVGSAVDTITGYNTLYFDNTFTRLGIGTNSPQTSLHVKTNASELLRLETGTTFGTSITFKNFSANEMAKITASTVSNRGGVLDFYTKPADNVQATPSVRRMRIDSSGNVGLNLTTTTVPATFCFKTPTTTSYSGAYTGSDNSFVETTDAVVGNLATIPLDDNYIYFFTVSVIVRRDDGGFTQNASFNRTFKAYRNGGGVAIGILDTIGTDDPTGIGTVPAFSSSGDNVSIDVTGEAGKTLIWMASWTYSRVSSST